MNSNDNAKYNLPERVEREIISLARQCDLDKVILFGSRARKTNRERSDIDLAISGGDCDHFALDANEAIWTLLQIDVVNLDDGISQGLSEEIKRDGVLIYEKSR